MNLKSQTELVVPLVLAFGLGLLLMTAAYIEVGWFRGRWNAAIVAALVITATGLWFLFLKRDVVDMEKAGDGCYYLGLIFTLFSLVFVLVGFEDVAGERTADVIPKFGVALTSTFFGVIFRVALQSFSSDDEIGSEPLTPEGARALYGNALAHATRRTLHEMRTAEESFSRLARSARREAESMEIHVARSGQQAGVAASKAFERMAENIHRVELSVGQMQKQVAAHAQQIREVKAETKLLTEFTRDAVTETAKHVSASRKVTNDLNASMVNFRADAEKTAKSVHDAKLEVEATVRESENVVQVLENVATNTKTVLNGFESDIRTAAEHLKETDRKTVAAVSETHAAAERSQEYASSARQELKNLHADIQSAADNLKEAGKNSAAVITTAQAGAAKVIDDATSSAKKKTMELKAEINSMTNDIRTVGQEASAAISAAKDDATKSVVDAVFQAKRVSSEVVAEINRASGILKSGSQDSTFIEPEIAEKAKRSFSSKGRNSDDSKR